MNTIDTIKELINTFGEYGVEKNEIPFDTQALKGLFGDEQVTYITFSSNTTIFVSTSLKDNVYYYQTGCNSNNRRKSFTEVQLVAIESELRRQIELLINLTNEVLGCKDDELEEFLLEKVVKPYMVERYPIIKNYWGYDVRRHADKYLTKPVVSFGKRGCDNDSPNYKAIIIGEGYNDYLGGFTITKNKAKMFAPLAGESRWNFEPKTIVTQVRYIVRWICS